MASIKRSYIDSHWLVFIIEGIIAVIFSGITLFTSMDPSYSLIPTVGIALLCLSVVEFANSLYRSHNRQGWLVSVLIALFDAIFGITLFVISSQGMVWHVCLLAAYTIIRGIFEFFIGFRTTVDPTDRFIWLLCGVAGLIFGVAILNSGHLQYVDFVRFFGAYLLIIGISSLIYGVHNRVQQQEDRAARREIATSTKNKSRKRRSSSKKS